LSPVDRPGFHYHPTTIIFRKPLVFIGFRYFDIYYSMKHINAAVIGKFDPYRKNLPEKWVSALFKISILVMLSGFTAALELIFFFRRENGSI
jgi:hypothetical protein